jgi:glycosyltransferase involved in cell wall biosynthesis
VQAGENILLADTPGDFADSVVSLLRDPEERKRMGASARVLVQENYSWPKVAENFARALHDVLISFKPHEVSDN